MGVIRKQSVWGTIITYLGAILGFITTGILFPRIFASEQIGLLTIIVSYATVLSTFSGLGINQVVGRFFPYFKNKEKNHNGFMFLLILVPLIGFILISFFYPLIQNFFIKKSGEDYLLTNYIIYVIPFLFVILFFDVFDNYFKFLHNITLGSFSKEVLQRIIILLGAILFFFSIISFENFFNIYLLAFAVPLFVMIISLIYKKEFSIKPQTGYLSKKLRNSMISMGLFGIISSFAGIINTNIDKIMIERLMGLNNVGVYTIAFFFGVLIVMPSRPLIKISSAYISEAWRRKDIELIRKIYIKSSINQFIIGLLLLIGIWCNIHNIFKILPPEYYEGKWVILIIGLAYLSDMMIGTSANILVNSRFYKFVTYIIVVLVVVSIFLNIVLIPLWGLIGAAIATFISKLVTNSLFVITLQKKYKLFPFNYKHIIIAGIGLFVYFINYFLPVNENYIFDIIYRSGIITLVFVTLIYLTKVSEDLNETMKYILNYILKIRNRN